MLLSRLLGAVLFFLFMLSANGQNWYKRWYFGSKAGLEFNSGGLSVVSDSRMFSFEGSTSICDPDGNLLFYTDGDTIWNRSHQPMEGFEPLIFNQKRESSVQSCMALPHPMDTNLFFLVLAPAFENRNSDSMIRCWIIDMREAGGLGKVVDKSISLFSAGIEAFAVTLHANGRDYWIASCENMPGKGAFKCIRSVDGQFSSPVQKTELPRIENWLSINNNKFSPNSKVFCSHTYGRLSLGGENQIFHQIFKFDNESGKISNPVTIRLPRNFFSRGTVEFSPDSRFLYMFQMDRSLAGISNFHIVQYDLSVWDSTSIANSATTIYSTTDYYQGMGCMQLGPDDKIYGFNLSSSTVSVIENPDKKGLACNYKSSIIDLDKGANFYGGPYYPTCFRKRLIRLGNDTILCQGDSIFLSSTLAAGKAILWNTGERTE